MSTAAAEILIRDYAKRLKLPTVGARAGCPLATEAAQAGHGPLEFLAALLEGEVHQREANVERARLRAAHFPELKELSSFEFSLVPSLNAALVAALARGSWIQHREVVLAVGPPGTGKSHVCTALGVEACRQGKRVRFVTVAELVTDLAEAQAQHRLSRLEEQLDRLDLLICDELGWRPDESIPEFRPLLHQSMGLDSTQAQTYGRAPHNCQPSHRTPTQSRPPPVMAKTQPDAHLVGTQRLSVGSLDRNHSVFS